MSDRYPRVVNVYMDPGDASDAEFRWRQKGFLAVTRKRTIRVDGMAVQVCCVVLTGEGITETVSGEGEKKPNTGF